MDHVAVLDAALARAGQDIVIRRLVGTTNQQRIDVTCRAKVRDYRPEEMTGGVVQGDSNVLISPTQIIRANWPGATTSTEDRRVPRANDKAIIAGRTRTILAASPTYVNGALVRITMQCRG